MVSKILAGARRAQAHAAGKADTGIREVHVAVPEVDVRQIRTKLEMTQEQFAMRFGFELTTLRNWEQGQRRPSGAARAFLVVISRQPQVVLEALQEAAHDA